MTWIEIADGIAEPLVLCPECAPLLTPEEGYAPSAIVLAGWHTCASCGRRELLPPPYVVRQQLRVATLAIGRQR